MKKLTLEEKEKLNKLIAVDFIFLDKLNMFVFNQVKLIGKISSKTELVDSKLLEFYENIATCSEEQKIFLIFHLYSVLTDLIDFLSKNSNQNEKELADNLISLNSRIEVLKDINLTHLH